jgi:hypothetical protein
MTEKVIDEKVRALIDEVKGDIYVAGYTPTDQEVVGVILSKFFKWNGDLIAQAGIEALRDSNFHTMADDFEKRLDKDFES